MVVVIILWLQQLATTILSLQSMAVLQYQCPNNNNKKSHANPYQVEMMSGMPWPICDWQHHSGAYFCAEQFTLLCLLDTIWLGNRGFMIWKGLQSLVLNVYLLALGFKIKWRPHKIAKRSFCLFMEFSAQPNLVCTKCIQIVWCNKYLIEICTRWHISTKYKI